MSGNIQMSKLQNYFMFDEEEANKSSDSVKNSLLGQFKATEFRTDKPYRLALYVHPSTKRKIDPANSALLANLSHIKRKNKENLISSKQIKKTKLPKEVNIALFDDDPGTAWNKREKNNRQLNAEVSTHKEPTTKVLQESILSYVNISDKPEKSPCKIDVSTLSKTKQKKIRRSYVKKCKEYNDSEKIVEPSSEKILKEIDMEKITKSKVKKPNKEDEEFEKWAENVNADFDEIDKFELSVNYE